MLESLREADIGSVGRVRAALAGRHAYLRYTTERRLSPAWTALPRDAPAVSRSEPANGTLRTEGPFPLASQSWHAPGGWRWALQHTPPRDAPEQMQCWWAKP